MIKAIHIIFALFLFSCNEKTNYTKEECEILSMKSFRGIPRDAHRFKKYCTAYQVTHTKEYCQKALNTLVISGSLKRVEKEFGQLALQCFTENDRNKFSR